MKVVKFKDFIDYDKRIGKMIITGLEGTGKTMLLARVAIGKMLHGQKDCWKSHDAVDEINALGFEFSKDYEHLAFGNLDVNCVYTNIPDRKIYKCNPYRLGLFNEYYDTDFYPPYSLICITEGYNFLNSYLYDKFQDSFKAYLKTCRQAKYDMVIDTHYFTDICTVFRRLTNRFIELFKPCEEIKDINSKVVGQRLFVREWKSDRDVEMYLSNGNLKNYDEYELILDMAMYENYDTEYCRFLHLENRENEDFKIECFDKIESIENLDNFGVNFGIVPTPGFFKGTKKSEINTKDDKEEAEEFDF